MRTISALLLLCLLALPARVPARAADAPPPTPQAVDEAIERGVEWLLGEQKPTGTWGTGGAALGRTALAVYALLHCGLEETQATPAARRLARALRWLDSHGAGTPRSRDTRTYETSLLLMLLRSRGREEDRGRMQALADLLGRTQAANGQWWYDGDARLLEAGDNSNTQFAVLALAQAHGGGLRVAPEALQRTRTWWIGSQRDDGGFGYASGGSARSAAVGSMTAAGVACLALADAVLGRGDGQAEAARARATAHLAQVFSVTRNDGPTVDRVGQRQRQAGRGWLHYYLWTVERAMVLGGAERLGSVDWYAAGAARLLATQKKDGSWRGELPLYATCFALLFLSRAADPPRAFTPPPASPAPAAPPPPVTGGGPPPAAPAPPLPAAPEPPRAPAGRVQDWLREALPPGELPARCRAAGPASLLPLVRALDDPDRAVRQRAFEALRALLPDERTERVDRHPLPRGRLALWLRLESRHLVLADGRFRVP